MKNWKLVLLIVITLNSCGTETRKTINSNLYNNDFELSSIKYNQAKTEEIYFILLKDENSISLNTYVDSEISEIRVFAVSENSIFTTDKYERVVILDTSNNTINIYCINTFNITELSIPFDIKPKTIFMNKENIFIGGTMGKELLVQYHIQSEKWFLLKIPKVVTVRGKAIDDIVTSDDFLIAIDNLVLPKYILFYHLNPTCKLLFSHFIELKPNGPYEEIHQGRISPKYLGLMSSTYSGYDGPSEFITVYKGLNLTSSFAISMEISRKDNFLTINDFLIIHDKIYIAHRINGLGIFEIMDSHFTIRRNNYYDLFNHKVENNFYYFQYMNEEILRLTLIPNNNKIVLTIRNALGIIRYEIKELGVR